jgi:hypothetical protein
MGLLRKVVDGGQAVVMVTHDAHAASLANHVIDAFPSVERGEQLGGGPRMSAHAGTMLRRARLPNSNLCSIAGIFVFLSRKIRFLQQ